MKSKIGILSWGSLSALGSTKQDIWENYLNSNHFLSGNPVVGQFNANTNSKLEDLAQSNKVYKRLDSSVLQAVFCAREAMQNAKWDNTLEVGVNIGSSRGATQLFEHYFQEYQEEKYSPLASPSTTLGNVSSWIAQDLGINGPVISHSITCSSASQAFLNAIAWMEAGFTNLFIVGGTEAPLTNFTIKQMQALKIYSQGNQDYPCKSLDLNKTENTMCLGEGTAVFCLEKNPKKALAYITGFGYATEHINTPVSVSEDGHAMEKAMEMALKGEDKNSIDVIITHTPGTIKGDQSEVNAVNKVFKNHKMPALTSNKWKIGHTLGASSALSIEMALLMMEHNQFIPVPFLESTAHPKSIQKVLINAIGFGGNAVSILIENKIEAM